MNPNDNIFIYSLENIANWNNQDDQEDKFPPTIEVPILQRGLVWNEIRMELLWDSIMRNIPIGTFIAIKGLKNQSKKKPVKNKEQYFLIDGQQRANSISLAFEKFKSANTTILWLDINPDEAMKQSDKQKFFFKITTLAHPWGFKNTSSESNIKLPIHVIRETVESEERPFPYYLYPLDAILPIPFYYLIKNQAVDSYEEFCKSLIHDIDTCESKWAERYKTAVIDFIKKSDHQFRKLYETIRKLKIYKLITLLAPEELADVNKDNSSESISDVSVLFERINRLGIRPTDEELLYSVIKSFMPEARQIDELAKNRMPPYRMMMLALRTYFTIKDITEKEKSNWSSDITILKLKKIFYSDNEEWGRITSFLLKDEFKKLINKVDIWLGFNENNPNEEWGILRFHRTSIAQESIDIYQLLLILAHIDRNKLDAKIITALATYLHWFSNNKRKTAIEIYERIRNSDNDILKIIQSGIARAINNNFLRQPIFADEIAKMFPHVNIKDHNININYEYRIAIWGLLFHNEGKELLLYSVREFMKEDPDFKKYDPANISMWKDYNRPWDYDHIIPKSWISNKKSGKFRTVCKRYIDTIGNFAPIPFSINRAKKDNSPAETYKDIYNGLLIDIEKLKGINKNFFKTEDAAKEFICLNQKRFITIYQKWFNDLDVERIFKNFYFEENSNINKRKCIFDTIFKEISSLTYYICEGARDIKVENMKDIDFCSNWLTIGKEHGEYFVALTSDSKNIEIGIRTQSRNQTLKNKELLNIINNDGDYELIENPWWHIVSYRSINDVEVMDCVNDFIKLYKIVDTYYMNIRLS